jgi:phosphoglycolate phosphatase-like HAD superfamily hydrolase
MTDSPNSESEFIVVDYDRTLADADKQLAIFIEVAEQHGAISRDQIMAADADVKLRGDSLDTAKYVRDHLREQNRLDEWQNLERQFIHESRFLNVMLPGATEMLEWLKQNGKRHGILTYGNPLWQRMKLTAAGFNHYPHIIMERKEKGRFITGWQTDDGIFAIPHEFGGGVADSVVLIDDKAVSFADFPGAPSRGIWVVDKANMLPSQKGEVPDNVSHVTDLTTIIDILEN